MSIIRVYLETVTHKRSARGVKFKVSKKTPAPEAKNLLSEHGFPSFTGLVYSIVTSIIDELLAIVGEFWYIPTEEMNP